MTEETSSKKPAPGRLNLGRVVRLGLFTTVALFACLYLAFSPSWGRSLYYLMLFRPLPYPYGFWDKDQVDGIKAKEIWFANREGTKLNGWYYSKPGAKRVVLISHGQAGNLTSSRSFAEIFLKGGASVLTYDYSGYGKSKGSPSMGGLCSDANAAYDYLQNVEHWKPAQIVSFGVSMGTGPASHLAQDRKCAGVVLIAPFTTFWTTCKDHVSLLSIYPDILWPDYDYGALLMARSDHPPLLIVHGDQDTMLPIAYSEQIVREGKPPIRFVKLHCGHGNFGTEKPRMIQAVTDFVKGLPGV